MRSTRRTMATRGRGRARNLPSNTQTNNDHCDVCTYGGRMMCCDGCPRAFHFTCLVPPLDVDNPPTGNWYCRECSAESARQPQQRGRKGRRKGSLFKELKDKARTSNPTSFMLPENIRNAFDGVFAGKHGEFRDSNKEKPVQLDKRGYPVEPDREKFTDGKGLSINCYCCKLPPKHLKPVMSCDFCDQHWHFDCLTPPLTIAPPLHKKWMCPLHADHVLPPMRRLRGEDVLPYMDNTAVEHPPERRRIECDPEFYLNDTLHRLPKQSVRLDWIGQMKAVLEEKNDEKNEGKNEEMLQMMASAERTPPSKKEGKKPEVPSQKYDKGKGKEFFRGYEDPIREKGKGKDVVRDKGKFVPIGMNVNEFENDFISAVSTALLPASSSTSTTELLDEESQMAIAIEVSRKKSRVEYGNEEDEEEDEDAGPSGSNGDNYEDERVSKRLRPEDYESSTSSPSSTNVRVHNEPAQNRIGREGWPEDLKVKERIANRSHQDFEDNDENEESITRNNENDEGNPLFLLIEAAFGGF